MTKHKFEELCLGAVKIVKETAPYDTGNLSNNAIKFEWIDDNTFSIYVDGDGKEGVAPYMPFTNEPWISPKWNGKKNPNEGWWQEAVEKVVEYILQRYKGQLK